LDEFSKPLLKEKRTTIPAKPGQPIREDSKYLREGSATAFLVYAPLDGIREVHISEDGRRTAKDYADVIEYVVDVMFPNAEKVILVEDNLNTHKDASLYENFPPEKARRLADKIERHHTPKHGSWLNIAEIEISALSRTTLPDRVGSLDEFRHRCTLGVSRRNEENVVTNWRFTNENARIKLKRLYPSIEE
jgi:hypothetical protein